MSDPNVIEQPKASPVVACSDLLAAMEQAFRDRRDKLTAQLETTKDSDDRLDILWGIMGMEQSAEAMADAIQKAANAPVSDGANVERS